MAAKNYYYKKLLKAKLITLGYFVTFSGKIRTISENWDLAF